MNEADTINLLRTHLADHHLTRPVADVVARGHALRVRRRRPVLVAAAITLAGGGITAATALGNSTPAFADWSATPETAPADVVAAIDTSCRRDLGQPAAALAVVDRRGANAVAVYTSEAGDYQCTRFQGSGGPGNASWWTQGGGGGPQTPTDPGSPLQVTGNTTAFNVHEGSMTALSGRVSPDITQVTATVGARTIDGAISGGAFDVWWPAIGADTTPVRVTASSSDGHVVSTVTVTVPGFGTG